MKDKPKKSRSFQLHPACNPGKALTLEAVHTEYLKYANLCATFMLDSHVLTMERKAEPLTLPIMSFRVKFPKVPTAFTEGGTRAARGMLRGQDISGHDRYYTNLIPPRFVL